MSRRRKKCSPFFTNPTFFYVGIHSSPGFSFMSFQIHHWTLQSPDILVSSVRSSLFYDEAPILDPGGGHFFIRCTSISWFDVVNNLFKHSASASSNIQVIFIHPQCHNSCSKSQKHDQCNDHVLADIPLVVFSNNQFLKIFSDCHVSGG